MLIVSPDALLAIQTAIVGATHGLVDQNGERVTLGTIDDRRLRSAAEAALLIAVGETVWPADRKISFPKPKQAPGPFVQEN